MGGLIEIFGSPLNAMDAVLLVWLAFVAGSVGYFALDNFVRNNPEETVMKWGWVLITLYMGPIALALYILTDKEPRPGPHADFIKPLWKQGVGSTVHCLAGDATGIIAAAVISGLLVRRKLDRLDLVAVLKIRE